MTLAQPPAISVSSLTGTHPLYLARELAPRGTLAAYYTTLPSSRTTGVPERLVHRHLMLLPLIYAQRWTPLPPKRHERLIERQFDKWMSRRVVMTDVAHALAGLGLQYRRAARRRCGALTVCDCQTSHVAHQRALVDAEHARWKLPPPVWSEERIASVQEEYEESDLLLVPSRFVYQSMVDHGVAASKLALVPYGVDEHEYRPVPRHDTVFRVLFVGTLTARKGLGYLFEAMEPLQWKDAELALRGSDAPDTGEMLRRYRGRIPLVRVPPRPRSELKSLYSNASVLVLPSVEDAFGLVIGQALACGTTVIASTHTGGPDVIEDGVNGFIVPAGDTTALRRALQNAYEDRERLARMGREARRRIEQARGWTTYAAGVIEACSAALERRAAPARGQAI